MYAVNRIAEAGSEYYSDSGSNSGSSFFPPFDAGDSNDELADKITNLAGQINAAEYRFLKMIGEFDRRVAWEGAGIRSCAYWLNWKCGIAIGAALIGLRKPCLTMACRLMRIRR